jgi:hypothetical protein
MVGLGLHAEWLCNITSAKHYWKVADPYLEKYNNQPDMANFPVDPIHILTPHFWSIHFNIILHLAYISQVVSPPLSLSLSLS